MSVVIETTLGDITVDLYISERPRTCLNFLKLCKIKYYNYNLFHTISRGFMAQTGDPTGSRSGGESLYGVLDGSSKRYFESENEPRIKHTKMGLISFVGNDDRMIGSQFFITLGEDLTYLDQKHCVFGEVVEGHNILEELNEVICDIDDRPYQDVRITHTVILDDPYPDPRKLAVPSRSPSPSAERLQGGRIAPDEEIDETEGKTAEEVAEVQADREAKARATILEMVGDLPDAEMAPPENVLFVCKLNPVTTDDDLEIIFNRFGKIVSCEVIRDRKTGDSLQYAFIEFSDRKSCEDAYFKMDNILIDDRRIHVDFSQSVSKVKWLGKGRGVAHFDEKGRRTTNPNKSVGKGNYKVNIGDRPSSPSNGRHDLSKRDKEINSRNKSNSPLRNVDRENNSRRYKDRQDRGGSKSPKRQQRKKSISPRRYNNKSNYRESSSKYSQHNSSRGSYNREDEKRYRRRGNRDNSSSPRRNEDSRNRWNLSSRDRRHESLPERGDENRRYGRDMLGTNKEYHSRSNYQIKGGNRRRSRSRSYDNRSDRNRDSRYHTNNPSSSKFSERNHRLNYHKNNDSENGNMSKQYNRKETRQVKSKIDSESSDSEIETRKNERKSKTENSVSRKEKINKKYQKKKTESDSESESSNSENNKRKSKKAKTKISNNRTKKIKKTSSSSDSSETSDSSDSVSSDTEEDKKKMEKHKKKRHDSTDSSDSDPAEKEKINKRKK